MSTKLGDARALPLPDASVDAVVTDPPYELGFMGRSWDRSGVAFQPETWAEVLRVARPGAYLLAFGGTRTFHRLTCAVEDAGWIVEDSIGVLGWVHAQGFPKGKNKLKPAWEPIVLARKAGPSVLGVDACRVEHGDDLSRYNRSATSGFKRGGVYGDGDPVLTPASTAGRWPPNLLILHHPDCADRCEPGCHVAELDAQSGPRHTQDPATRASRSKVVGATKFGTGRSVEYEDEKGSGASRFYPVFKFNPKAPTRERPAIVRDGQRIAHPTVKPVALMRWLVRLVTPPGGTVLDPFCGSGATLEAAVTEGFDALGFDTDPDSVALTEQRLGQPIAATLSG